MSTMHTISRALRLFRGAVSYGRYFASLGETAAHNGVEISTLNRFDLGVPIAASANGISLSQAVAAAGLALLNGAAIVSGAFSSATPRNIVAAWTGASIITVRGTDQYGEPLTESSASGTAFVGKKAFKTVTSVTFSAAVTAATVGFGNVLGLPFSAITLGRLIAGLRVDGVEDTGVTFVAADATSPATATTGDTRGTVTPAAGLVPNGTRRFTATMYISDTSTKTAVFGVDQYGL